MKKLSLMIACVGIISSAVFASKHFPVDYQNGKAAPKNTAKTEQAPTKPVPAMKESPAAPIAEPQATAPARQQTAPQERKPMKKVGSVGARAVPASSVDQKK
jgi:hypothetical protein